VRIAFLGTPQVAVPALSALIAADDLEVVVVVTNPDRPRGRSKRPMPPPVKVAAERAGIPVWQPARPAEIVDELAALELDAGAVVAYGALLPEPVLGVVGRGLVNLHFSLLPRWRGAAPVHHAIRAGDTLTGVTTFVLDRGMDTGPILDQLEVAIDPAESAGELLERLAERGAPVLVRSVRRLLAGDEPVPQSTSGASLAPKITPEEVGLDLRGPAREIADLARSADPVPGAHTTFRGRRLKVYRATPAPGSLGAERSPPGRIVAVGQDGVLVACGDGAVRLEVVQPEGKARMDAASFVNGYHPQPGERLGDEA
jgi:methionyl-tRNA formyltransferase